MFPKIKPRHLLSLAVLLSGCTDGFLTLSVADAPVDNADKVFIEFTGVEVLDADNKTHEFAFDPPLQLNILSTNGSSSLLLDQVRLPAGDYQSITLKVSAGKTNLDSKVTLKVGGDQQIELPDGNVSLLTVSHAFSVERNKKVGLTADFDLRKSILEPQVDGEPFELQPSLSIISDDQAATLTGTASAALLSDASCSPAVYIYSGSNVTPDDVGGTPEPVASALVLKNSGGQYTAAFLNPGTYTASLTCEAADDDPVTNDPINFVQSKNFTVTAGKTATVNFQ